MIRTAILGFPGVQALDVAGINDVFARAGHVTGVGCRVTTASRTEQPATTESGLAFSAARIPETEGLETEGLETEGLETEGIDTLVLPGGPGVHEARSDPEVLAWIRTASRHARRIVATGRGAFFAAQAGLLDGCRATTHWSDADRLAREFPAVGVVPGPGFLRSSPTVWTSAGMAAGIAVALAVVEEDFGAETAQEVARWLVPGLRCQGGRPQFTPPVWTPPDKRDSIRAAQDAIAAAPGADHTLAALAHRATMSPRHFTRVFTATVGETPSAHVERIRTEAACRQLDETTDTVGIIAVRCGFGTAETMRRTFLRRIGVTPSEYRRGRS